MVLPCTSVEPDGHDDAETCVIVPVRMWNVRCAPVLNAAGRRRPAFGATPGARRTANVPRRPSTPAVVRGSSRGWNASAGTTRRAAAAGARPRRTVAVGMPRRSAEELTPAVSPIDTGYSLSPALASVVAPYVSPGVSSLCTTSVPAADAARIAEPKLPLALGVITVTAPVGAA